MSVVKNQLDADDDTSHKPTKRVKTDDGAVEVDNGQPSNSINSDNSVAANACPPSRVVHIRNIPYDATEADLINFGVPFGKIVNQMLMKGNNQAFIEFETFQSAEMMVKGLHPSIGKSSLRAHNVWLTQVHCSEFAADSVRASSLCPVLEAPANQERQFCSQPTAGGCAFDARIRHSAARVELKRTSKRIAGG